jgi:tRNA threonylcarbamoyladenosine modification (KEOPS) complex  Pcc1 subunit
MRVQMHGNEQSLNHRAEFEIMTSAAPVIVQALMPEIENDDQSRSHICCTSQGVDRVVIKFSARDIPALRASLNLWLRLAGVSEEMHDIVSHHT